MITFNQLGKYGRLGNQLFQIAATIGIAKKHNQPYAFPEWEYAKDISVPTFTNTVPHKVWHEQTFHFNPKAFTDSFSGNIDLQGYFQSERYFEHCKEEIINSVLTHQNKERIECFTCGHTIGRPDIDVCAIHIRRGDYMHLQNHYVDLVNTSYYTDAINHVRSFGVKHFVIFTDDPVWCETNLRFDHDDDFLYSHVHSPFDDLLLMSACTCHIIANSSFSWWGSYLANSKLTIAPKKWFGPAITHDTKDLYREDMVLM